MQRGEIYDVLLPVKPPPGTPAGHVQYGPRPAVIVQHGGGCPELGTVLIVPITGSQKMAFKHSLFVQPSAANGLFLPSTILTHQLRAIDKTHVSTLRGRLDPVELDPVEFQKLVAELRAILSF